MLLHTFQSGNTTDNANAHRSTNIPEFDNPGVITKMKGLQEKLTFELNPIELNKKKFILQVGNLQLVLVVLFQD